MWLSACESLRRRPRRECWVPRAAGAPRLPAAFDSRVGQLPDEFRPAPGGFRAARVPAAALAARQRLAPQVPRVVAQLPRSMARARVWAAARLAAAEAARWRAPGGGDRPA